MTRTLRDPADPFSADIGDTMSAEKDIVETLNAFCTDYDGSQMKDGEPPLDNVRCGHLREAASLITTLREQVERLQRGPLMNYIVGDDQSELARAHASEAYALGALEREIQLRQVAESRVASLEKALESIALLDEADGHELTRDHASQAVAIATRTLGKHPAQITAERAALSGASGCEAAAPHPAKRHTDH